MVPSYARIDSYSNRNPNSESVWQSTKTHPLRHSSIIPTCTSCEHEPIIDFRPPYIERTSPLRVKCVHSAQTDDSLRAQPSNSSQIYNVDEYPQFPPNKYQVRRPIIHPPETAPCFALYHVTTFDHEHWKRIWAEPSLILDPYVVPLPNSDNQPRSIISTYFQEEQEFMGIRYRVRVDCSDLEPVIIRRGVSVNICNLNTRHGRYIVDTCQLFREERAYLIVHFREYYNQAFSDTRDSQHPSFVLDVPKAFCKSLLMPHLRLQASTHRNLLSRIIRYPSSLWRQSIQVCICGIRDSSRVAKASQRSD